MSRFLYLLKNELKVQIKIYNLLTYFFSFFFFIFIAVIFIYGLRPVDLYVIKLFLIFIPISLIFANLSFKEDLYNGHLDFVLTIFPPSEIILSKYFSVCICHFTISIFSLFVLFVFYSLNFTLLMLVLILVISLVLLSEALLVLVSVMQLYFEDHKNYLLTLIFPLMIPGFLFISVLLSNPQIYYVIAILSFVAIMVPVLLMFANFLMHGLKLYI